MTLEVDAGLCRALGRPGALPDGVELIHADALKFELRELALRVAGEPGSRRPVRVVANLPYSITGPLLRKLLDLRDLVADWSVMVQREVAERLCAEVGSRAYGSLTVLHRVSVRCTRLLDLKPGCFHPVPKVQSSFLRMTPLPAPLVAADDTSAFAALETLVRAAFAQRRKTLVNAVRGGLGGSAVEPGEGRPGRALNLGALEDALRRLGLDPRIRAEAVTPEQFSELARALLSDAARDPDPAVDSALDPVPGPAS